MPQHAHHGQIGFKTILCHGDESEFGYMFPDLANDPNAKLPSDDPTTVTKHLRALGKALIDPPDVPNDPDTTSNIPPVFTYLGQFIDHDITAQTDRKSMVSNIQTPAVIPQEPDYIVCNLKNLRRSFLELDSVYGDGRSFDPDCPTQAEARGFFDGAKMRVGQNAVNSDIPGERIPPDADLRRDLPRHSADRSPIIGDGRNDENLIVAQLHTAFLRFHNAIVDELSSGEAGLSEAGLFCEAARLVRWHYQWIVLHEYLPTIAKASVIEDILTHGRRFFRPKEGIFMPLEFSVAAFRFGHSMVRGSYDFNRNFGEGAEVLPDADFQQLFNFTGKGGFDPTGQGGSDGVLTTLPFNWIIEWDRFVAVNGNLRRSARKIDTRLADDLSNMQNELRGQPDDLPSTIRGLLIHLAMRNLLRGYSLSIPTGQALAHAMGITPMTESELKQGNSPELNAILDEACFIERTPAWYYILKESEVRECGNSLGDVGSRIVGETLIGLIEEDSDSFMNAGDRWTPSKGVGVATIQELLQYAGVLLEADACKI